MAQIRDTPEFAALLAVLPDDASRDELRRRMQGAAPPQQPLFNLPLAVNTRLSLPATDARWADPAVAKATLDSCHPVTNMAGVRMKALPTDVRDILRDPTILPERLRQGLGDTNSNMSETLGANLWGRLLAGEEIGPSDTFANIVLDDIISRVLRPLLVHQIDGCRAKVASLNGTLHTQYTFEHAKETIHAMGYGHLLSAYERSKLRRDSAAAKRQRE